MGRFLVLTAMLGMAAPLWAVDPGCQALIAQSNAQLEAMQRHAVGIDETLQSLNESLLRAEQRNAEQAQQIERLQAELRAQRAVSPQEHERQRRQFFSALRRMLPLSSVYDVAADRLIIATDPIFIFGKVEIGDEGRDRLTPVADALRSLVAQLPPNYPWRLRIEGHSDSRPLQNHPRFASNWELSSARAVSVLQFLVEQGLPEDRLTAVGMAETQPRDPGESTAAHRRNRRIEIHLAYGALPLP